MAVQVIPLVAPVMICLPNWNVNWNKCHNKFITDVYLVTLSPNELDRMSNEHHLIKWSWKKKNIQLTSSILWQPWFHLAVVEPNYFGKCTSMSWCSLNLLIVVFSYTLDLKIQSPLDQHSTHYFLGSTFWYPTISSEDNTTDWSIWLMGFNTEFSQL